jgi:hypothetical protein
MIISRKVIVIWSIIIIAIIIAFVFFLKWRNAPGYGYVNERGETRLSIKGNTYDTIEDKHWRYVKLDKDIGGMEMDPYTRFYTLKNDPDRVFIQRIEIFADVSSWIQKRTDISLPELAADNVEYIVFTGSQKPAVLRDPVTINRIMDLYLSDSVNDEVGHPAWGYRLYLYFKGFPQVHYAIEIWKSDFDGIKYFMEQYEPPNKSENKTIRIPDDLASLLLKVESE